MCGACCIEVRARARPPSVNVSIARALLLCELDARAQSPRGGHGASDKRAHGVSRVIWEGFGPPRAAPGSLPPLPTRSTAKGTGQQAQGGRGGCAVGAAREPVHAPSARGVPVRIWEGDLHQGPVMAAFVDCARAPVRPVPVSATRHRQPVSRNFCGEQTRAKFRRSSYEIP